MFAFKLMKNKQKILGGTPTQTNIDFFVWGGGSIKFCGSTNVGYIFGEGSKKNVDNNLGGVNRISKNIFLLDKHFRGSTILVTFGGCRK